MTKEFKTLSELLAHGFDTVIDVRSPAEYAEDHIPGAINLPVLDNAERAEVGTIYKQESPFLARKIGAAKVFRNSAHHIETALRDQEGGWRPLVYCWRGGQRSGSFGWMLGQIGWRSDVINGGYRTYRRLVNQALYTDPLPHRLIALDGYTGTAKTEVLHLLAKRGVQVLDLEGLAAHRGSLLGGMADPQPSQKAFESALAVALNGLDPARPVVVEAESSKIGERIIPPSLWVSMKVAPRIEIMATTEARTRYLVQAYDDILSDADRLRRKLNPLRMHRSHAVVDGWMAFIDAGDKAGLTRALMEQHYDPSYEKSRRAIGAVSAAQIQTTGLAAPDLDALAGQIETVVDRLSQVPVRES
ncbi:tRNA 2-selenouridine(34) synthase MnmH [Falsiphaeobacter marinintestinus]|uniref:tRNA 2-selenouridine(34) synthase MnmH n=1 Tax=Falsiphaeobacter marinintestinus TaxID=1492905 RepID=UPI0011B56E9E|nr:tRNA 2-selenouridine(34) synthase MnmH [Phaeobacter marinintestinus]